jgi:ADP-heptose:LPS heptosyltransferase
LRICVNRKNSFGDVLIATSILPALKKKYPEAELCFSTKRPGIFRNNPFVNQVYSFLPPRESMKIIDLDLAYEKTPLVQMMQAYADVAEVPYEDCVPFLHRESFELPFDDYVVFHFGTTDWVGRNWIPERWIDVLMETQEKAKTVCVGTGDDALFLADVFLNNQTNIWQLADVIARAKLFVGIDSFPFQIAQTFNVPSIVFFGSILPQTRVFRDNVTPISAENLECLGCHQFREVPVRSTHECKNGDLLCEKMVTKEQFIEPIDIHINNG